MKNGTEQALGNNKIEGGGRALGSVATEGNGRLFVRVISDGVSSLEKEKFCGVSQAFWWIVSGNFSSCFVLFFLPFIFLHYFFSRFAFFVPSSLLCFSAFIFCQRCFLEDWICILWRKNKDLTAVSGIGQYASQSQLLFIFLDKESQPMCIIVKHALIHIYKQSLDGKIIILTTVNL